MNLLSSPSGLLSTSQAADLCHVHPDTFRRWVHQLHVPFHTINGAMFFQVDGLHPLLDSLAVAEQTERQAVYSVPRLAKRMGKHRDTMRRWLRASSIPLYRAGTKLLVMLVDIQRAGS